MDIADIKDILRILEEQEITEFEMEQDGVKLRVCRAARAVSPAAPIVVGAPAVAGVTVSAAAPQPQAPGAGADGDEADPGVPNGTVVKSPIVGTFYRAADPNSPSFVNVGDRIKLGQVLCIIEAMKLMNEIEAEVAGEIVKIHVENGQPVQYGDPLFTVRPV